MADGAIVSRSVEIGLRAGTELLFLSGSIGRVPCRFVAERYERRLPKIPALCAGAVAAVRPGLRTDDLRLALSLRAGTGPFAPDSDAEAGEKSMDASADAFSLGNVDPCGGGRVSCVLGFRNGEAVVLRLRLPRGYARRCAPADGASAGAVPGGGEADRMEGRNFGSVPDCDDGGLPSLLPVRLPVRPLVWFLESVGGLRRSSGRIGLRALRSLRGGLPDGRGNCRRRPLHFLRTLCECVSDCSHFVPTVLSWKRKC